MSSLDAPERPEAVAAVPVARSGRRPGLLRRRPFFTLARLLTLAFLLAAVFAPWSPVHP